MNTLPYDWTFRRIMGKTLIVVLVAFCFYFLYRYYEVVLFIFIAIALGTVIRPVVTWLNNKRVPKVWGVILVYLLLFAFIAGFFFLLFPLIAEQVGKISAAIPGYYQSLRVWMVNNPIQLIVRLSVSFPATLPGLVSTQQTGQQMLTSAGQALGIVVAAANAIFMITAILILGFHWTIDGPRTIQLSLLLVAPEKRETVAEVISAIESKVGYFIAGQAILCLVIAIMALIVYLIIGLPNAVVLALIAGVLEAVPMVGPILGAIPAGIVALSINPVMLIWVVIGTIIIQQIENSLLVPRIMRKAVGVNPFVSLLAIFGFSSLFGIIGALMAIPFAAIIQILLDRFVFRQNELEPEGVTGRDYSSRLRYETQKFTRDLRKQARLKKRGSDQQVKKIDQVMDEIEMITTDLDHLLAQETSEGQE